jgi:hypothetical protein
MLVVDPHHLIVTGPSTQTIHVLTRKDDATTSIHSVKVDHHLMMHQAIKVNDRLVNNVTGLLLVVLDETDGVSSPRAMENRTGN